MSGAIDYSIEAYRITEVSKIILYRIFTFDQEYNKEKLKELEKKKKGPTKACRTERMDTLQSIYMC